jgi:PilZ domain
MSKRRVARRHNLALPIILAELPQNTRVIHGTTRNISTHGLYFTTDLSVATGLSLEFSFTLPADIDQENQAIVAGRAKVVRVEEPGSGFDKVGIAVAIESFKITRSG